MNNQKKALVMGATGSMGHHLVPHLLEMGYKVDGVSIDDVTSTNTALNYIKADCYDTDFMASILKNNYDVIVDFMFYRKERFEDRYKLFLDNTKHYIFLSSYRVYANEQIPITEKAPQLYDTLSDEDFLNSHDYALEKSRCEDVLEKSNYKNWTIVRPAIVISRTRFPLITVETAAVLGRAAEHKHVLLPAQAKNVHASMIWAGDAANMIAHLTLNPKAFGEHYTIATAEQNTWEDIVGYYHELAGVNPIWIDKEEHLKIMASDPGERINHRRGLEYDRLFERIIDNRKVLEATGLKQSDLTSVKDAIKKELAAVPQNKIWPDPTGVCKRMDEYMINIKK